MPLKIDIHKFLRLRKEIPVIDVRSPAEYSQGHIPGAINIPLFNDSERAAVGTVYVKSGPDKALLLALKLAGPHLEEKIIALKKIQDKGKLLVHCWRGGIRSSGMAWLFDLFGYESLILDGGYKAYRRNIKDLFNREIKLIIIGGMTGSGKTRIIECLSNMGFQTLDFEKLAKHKGSVFGNLKQEIQPSTEQFENDIFEIWQAFDLSEIIFVEDESISIGKVNIPPEIYNKMQLSPVIEIVLEKNIRIDSLVKDYASFDKVLLKEGIEKIQKRLGSLNAKQAQSAIDEEQFSSAAEIILKYYDKAYREVINSRNANNHFSLSPASANIEDIVREVLELIVKNKIHGTVKINAI